LIFRQGSWTDQPHEKPLNAEQHLCPACLRIRDGFPAAELRLSGVLFAKRSDEILQLIHNIEAKQRHDHPLERIMDIADLPDGTLIRFTGVHIAQRVAKAIKRAHRGCLESRYTDSETLMRISWQSE
jgi:NMD protein affecting ribosome stability and mRNA decay